MGSLEELPPDGVHHYDTAEDVPFQISKYWHQRHNIFSKYDDGIWLTDDAWFGVTPEPVANKIAEHVATASKTKTILVDAFAGAGGNAIAFARSGRWNQIFAFEKDPKVLACAKHNAEIYGVKKKIFWVEGDVFKELGKRLKALAKNVVVFGSPPWGGPTYSDYEVFDLNQMHPYPLAELYNAFSSVTNHVVLYLPRTSDLKQLAKRPYANEDDKLEVIHYCMHGASKAICVFFGDFRKRNTSVFRSQTSRPPKGINAFPAQVRHVYNVLGLALAKDALEQNVFSARSAVGMEVELRTSAQRMNLPEFLLCP